MSRLSEVVEKISALEAEIYPKAFCSMSGMDCWEDLQEYSEGNPTVLLWDYGYLILTKKEVVDLASKKPLTLGQIREVVLFLSAHFRHRKFKLLARKKTSQKLVEWYHHKGVWKVKQKDVINWEGEEFQKYKIRFKQKLPESNFRCLPAEVYRK